MTTHYLHSGGRVFARLAGSSIEEAQGAAASVGAEVATAGEDVKDEDEFVQLEVRDGVVRRREARPSPQHDWDAGAQRWIYNVDRARNVAWAAVKTRRREIIESPILHTTFGAIDVDPMSVDNIAKALRGWDEAARLGSAPDTIDWTMADNSAAALTREQLGSVAALLLARGNAAFDVARTLRTAIYASDEPEAITWPADGA